MPEERSAPPKGRSCWFKGFIALCLIALVLGVFWWWHNRPIRPVVLSEQEKQQVEEKVEAIQAGPDGREAADAPEEPDYVPGKKSIVLTERELNGLLNERTSLGDKVRFELARDAIHARLESDLDEDLPVFGGRKLKARARFLVSQDEQGTHFVIDDVTVWGVSLPNDWLGGLKGRDLIGEALGGKPGSLAGVKSIEVVPGEIRVELKE